MKDRKADSMGNSVENNVEKKKRKRVARKPGPSLSSRIKDEIIKEYSKSSCCRRSLLYGALFARGRVEDGKIVVLVGKREYADYLAHLVKEFFAKEIEIGHPKSGGRCVCVSFCSDSASKYIGQITDFEKLLIKKCNGCLTAFLRGVFLASGNVTDSDIQYSLDFSLYDRCETFAYFLENISLLPLVSHRKAGNFVYFRDSEQIESFYGYAGFNQAIYSLIDSKINRNARRETQRFMNCVSNNHNRLVDVAGRQCETIKRLEELNLLSSLPDELHQTALLRVEFSELALSDLAAKHVPPISKSGLSHRLKNIEEIGKRLLEKSDRK